MGYRPRTHRSHGTPGTVGPGFRRGVTWRVILATGTATLVAAVGPAPAVGAVSVPVASSSSLTAVTAAPPLPAGAVAAGDMGLGEWLTVDIVLRPRDPGGLERLATSASTPGSPGFGRYLDRGTFARRFGADPAAVAALRSLGDANGLIVNPTADGLIVAVTGTVGRLEHLLHTRMTRVRLADGTIGRRSTTPAELPRSLAGTVSSVVGLDDLVQRQPASLIDHATSAADPASPLTGAPTSGAGTDPSGPHACPAAQADKSSGGVFTDDTIASLYGAEGLYGAGADGSGQAIDVYELEPFDPSDITAFDTCYFGVSAASAMAGRLQVIPVDGGQPSGPGVGEAALDIENVSAISPGARIDVYEAPNTTAGSLDEFGRIVADDNASVVTTSAGLCEAAMQSLEPGVQQIENLLFEQAAAQGQTVVAAAGDSGSSDCGTTAGHAVKPSLSVDDPASQPYVLAVGGTSVPSGASPVETAWGGSSRVGGGGGGLSQAWKSPGWQADSGVPGVADPTVIATAKQHAGARFCAASASTCREVPDVSAAADPASGAITVFYDGRWTAAGGTSSSAPLWAAMLSDTASTVSCSSGGRPGGGLGFAVPLLYGVAHDPASYAASFHDVTSGTNAVVPGANGLFPATTGYDMATGLGTPLLTGPGGVPGLAAALCSVAATTVPSVGGLTPNTVPVAVGTGQPAPVVTVRGTGFENPSGRPQVASVTIGGVRIAVAVGARSPVTVQDAGTLTVRVPPGAQVAPHGGSGDGAGSYQVVVTLVGGATSAPGPQSLLRYVAAVGSQPVPTVSAVGPTGGPRSGGDTVTVYGSGFDSATGVEFGSIPAPVLEVVSNDRLTATVPPEASGTECANPTDPATDVCQTQVVVTSDSGSSAPAPILPPYSGPATPGTYGGIAAPAGCGCETTPAATEYDYLASPEITSVTAITGADGRQYLSAYGRSQIVVRGVGFDVLGYQWTDLGPWGEAASVDLGLVSISPTELTVTTPAPPIGSVLPLALPVTVQTLASPDSDALASSTPPSNTAQVVYAPTATVSRVQGGTRRSAGPTTGGTRLTVTGTDFAAATSVLIVDEVPGGPSLATTTAFHVNGSKLLVATPPAAVGRDDVLVCTATTCSTADPQVDSFTYFAPGDPTLASDHPLGGPPGGGTDVALRGTDLGWVIAVRFGSVNATTFSNPQGTNDGGNPSVIDVTAPRGRAGATVPIRVETLASAVDGSGYSPWETLATFTYRAGH